VKPTPAMLRFLKKHLRTDISKRGYLTKWAGGGTYTFVDRIASAGLIEIVDPDSRFPYNWAGTRITDAGRAALSSQQQE
jgi:hypothetical protein